MAFSHAPVHTTGMSNDATRFLGAFIAAPRSVGAIWPSSPGLARAMLAPIDFATAGVVVEFGPGTGAFTGAIAARLAPGARYTGIELNPDFCARLVVGFPGLDFTHGSVADLAAIMAARGVARIDAIICGLPWASLPVALQDQVFTAIGHMLAPQGVFVTFAYVQGLMLPGAGALRRRLKAHFCQVERSAVVWRNVPPAFAYVCRGNAVLK
jgi:phosphatidylethanolamine/phosphatidyl-N-methylethanolamine N-methyltransferase